MKKLIKHIKTWNRWRKCNQNSKLHKFLVLIGFIHSPTFYLRKFIDEYNEPEIKPLCWNHNPDDEPLMKNCKVTVDELHNVKVEGEPLGDFKRILFETYGIPPEMRFVEASIRNEDDADEVLENILSREDSKVRATDDTVYVRTELTKDDIIESTDFDFKKWLEKGKQEGLIGVNVKMDEIRRKEK